MRKRALGLCLVLVLVAALIVPMGGVASSAKPTFKIAVTRHTLDKSAGMDEKVAVQRAEELTGIRIEWTEFESGTEAERINIMLASGDLPDAFLGGLSESQLVKNMASFTPLTDLIPEYAPHVTEQYNRYPDIWDMLTMKDGNIYTFMISDYTSPDNDADGIQFINKAWLDKLGLDKPTNLDEYYDMLVAVRDGDPNGNGLADEIPIIFCENNWASHITNFMGPWGFTRNYKIEDGQFIFTPTLPEFRDFLEFYHKLAAEKLIDVEGFSQTNQQFYAKLKEYVGITYYGWTPASNFDPAIAAEFVALEPMSAPNFPNQQVTQGQYQKPVGNRFGFAITTACKDPATLVGWFDAQNVDVETKMLWKYGTEGILWEFDDKGTAWTIFPETTADFTRENMKYTYGKVGTMPGVILPEELEVHDGEKYPESVVRINMVNAIKDYFPKEFLPIRSVDEEKVSERALIETDLNAYINSFIATSIVDGIDDAKWAKHLVDVETYGASAWVQWYQDFLDGKF